MWCDSMRAGGGPCVLQTPSPLRESAHCLRVEASTPGEEKASSVTQAEAVEDESVPPGDHKCQYGH